MFSPTLLSLFLLFFLHYYYYCLCFLLLFVITVIIISTELLAPCDGCLGWGKVWRAGPRGWVPGRAGLWGVLATWVLGSAAPAPRFLGTQPPYATQVRLLNGI